MWGFFFVSLFGFFSGKLVFRHLMPEIQKIHISCLPSSMLQNVFVSSIIIVAQTPVLLCSRVLQKYIDVVAVHTWLLAHPMLCHLHKIFLTVCLKLKFSTFLVLVFLTVWCHLPSTSDSSGSTGTRKIYIEISIHTAFEWKHASRNKSEIFNTDACTRNTAS